MQLSARNSRPIGNNSAMHFADDLRTSASEQSPFSRIAQRESGCAPDLRRTAKVILALSDFFRKLLSLQILASNATFSCQRPLRRQNNGERLSRRFPGCQHKYSPLYYLNDEIWRQDLTRTTPRTPPAKLLQPGEQPLPTRVLLNYKKRSQCQMRRTAHRVRWESLRGVGTSAF